VLLALLPWTSLSQAGAWLQSEGDSYFSARLDYTRSEKYWDQNSQLIDQGCDSLSKINTYYGDYGYSYYYTLFGKFSYLDLSCGDDQESGLGDIELGIRGRFNVFRNGRAWEVTLIAPGGYDKNSPVRLGYGRYGLKLGLAWRDLKNNSGYYEYGASFQRWEGPPADQLRLYFRNAFEWTPTFRTILGVNGAKSLRNGESEPVNFTSYERVSDSDHIRGIAEFRIKIVSGWSVRLGATQYYWGRDTSQTRGFHAVIAKQNKH